jgi:hypothetical protein
VLVKVRNFYCHAGSVLWSRCFFFVVQVQKLSFENRLSTINFKLQRCQDIDNKIDDVSKSASEICPDKRIGRRRNLSRYTIVILSYDTIKGLDERRCFRHGSRKYRCYWKIVKLKCAANFFRRIFTNGPAVEGVSVTRRSIRAGSSYSAPAGPENCHGARRVWHVFLQSGYKVLSEPLSSHGIC